MYNNMYPVEFCVCVCVVLKPYRVLRSKVVSMILNICVDLAFLASACSLGFLILYGLLYYRSFTQRLWTAICSSGEGLQLVVVLPCFGSVCWLCEVFYLESVILVWPHVKHIFWLLCRQKYETQGEGTIGDC